MKIVENGRAVCSIVLPKEPTPREEFAALELAAYIEKISGARPAISTGPASHRVIIGGPVRNPAAAEVISREEFRQLVPGPEGFLIRADEHTLLLAGSHGNPGEQERGTLYAVYEFLERYLGCSLAAFSKHGVEAGEFVPSMQDICVEQVTFVKKCCDVGYRGAIIQYGPWVGKPEHALNDYFISWLAKNRYNYILTWASVYEGFKKNGMLAETEKRGILFNVGHHEAINMLLPFAGSAYFPEHYGETHPEYFKLQEDGTRFQVTEGDYAGQLILCVRNEKMLDQLAENVVRWSDANPQVEIISLWPFDGKHEQCCCEKCRRYSKGENYSYLVNQVAQRVSRAKPWLKFDRISYLDMTECVDEELSHNVIVDESLWHEQLRTVGKPDGSCFIGSEFEQNILRWKQTGANVIYYDYLMGIYACGQKWLPAADEMQASCNRMKEVGIWGLGTQLEVYNIWNHIFNFYCYGRTAYNTELSMEQNLEFFGRIFGAGAPYVQEVVRMGEAVADGQTVIKQMPGYVMEHIDRAKVYALYEEAFAAAKDAFSRNNIRLMRMVFRYSDLGVHNNGADELGYMHQHFDSFTSGKEGFGIAFPVEEVSESRFSPDKWYVFE